MQDFGISAEQAERLLKDDAVEFIADRCDLVDEGAEAFVQVWKGSPLEYRRLLSRSPRMFVRALAGYAVQLATVSSVREIADRVMDAWEHSYIALKVSGSASMPVLFRCAQASERRLHRWSARYPLELA